ncbi:hypothetical protein [Streptomyces sp. CAU 1734]|uniref:hypothetical protein n=1 Tax=Streptomyces sp. CAU 1734 TaxID=3140360 RepID=UPI00326176E6
MIEKLPVWLVRAFSRPRLSRYVVAAQGDPQTAVRLYWWNITACAALYGPLHCLELALRNALHDRLSEAYNRADWWETAPLDHHARRLVAEARRKCERRGTVPTSDAVIAELSFGFWVSLLSRGYDRSLWVPTLHRAFPLLDEPRRQLHDGLSSLVLMRNRIMHHEPVHHRDLAADHAKIYRMLGYLSPELAVEAKARDRFPEVLADRAASLAGTRPTRF